MRLRGLGQVVQIDEYVIACAKYNRGRRLFAQPKWIFGIYDPVSKVGYVEMVPNRNAHMLRRIIRRFLVPGTKIWRDKWQAYGIIGQLGQGYIHRTVNHSRHFRDPVTSVCMNHVEAYWRKFAQKSAWSSCKLLLLSGACLISLIKWAVSLCETCQSIVTYFGSHHRPMHFWLSAIQRVNWFKDKTVYRTTF